MQERPSLGLIQKEISTTNPMSVPIVPQLKPQ
jgi:hypothetical protein